MPRLVFHAIAPETVTAAHGPLQPDLEAILGDAAPHTVFEVAASTFVPGPSFPCVEVAMFDRGKGVQDALAQALTRRLKEAGCPSVDVFFTRLERRGYYEDGEPLEG